MDVIAELLSSLLLLTREEGVRVLYRCTNKKATDGCNSYKSIRLLSILDALNETVK